MAMKSATSPNAVKRKLDGVVSRKKKRKGRKKPKY